MTTTDTTDTSDLDELRALWGEQTAKRDDAEDRLAQLDAEVKALLAQQADVRKDAAAQLADAKAELAQLGKRIRTREAANAAGEVEILAEAPEGGDKTPKRSTNPFCNSPHPTDRHTSCKRLAGHDGDHAAHTFRITEPETWADAEGSGDE